MGWGLDVAVEGVGLIFSYLFGSVQHLKSNITDAQRMGTSDVLAVFNLLLLHKKKLSLLHISSGLFVWFTLLR